MWPTRLNADGNCNLPTSWESRYIGALRATRTAVLDGYMMGALDSLPVAGSVVADPEFLKPGQSATGTNFRMRAGSRCRSMGIYGDQNQLK